MLELESIFLKVVDLFFNLIFNLGILKRPDSDMPKRDYVYYLAIAHTRIKVYIILFKNNLKEYDRALEYINLLLSAESDNHQALDLKLLIERRMNRGFIF